MAEHTFAGLTCTEVADLAPAFVLGALEAAESDAVRRHLAECPEAHAEPAQLHSVVPALFEVAEAVAPPAGLKDRILAAAGEAQRTAGPVRAAGAPHAPAPAPIETARDVQRPRAVEEQMRQAGWTSLFRRPFWAGASLAAVVAVAVMGAWNLQIAGENEALRAYRAGVVAVLEQAAAPGAEIAVLAPAEGSGPAGLAAIGSDGTVALVMRDLAPTTGTQVYETWLIAGGNAPVPVGEFTVATGGLGTFRTVESGVGDGVVIALTLEPGPDSTTPTLPIVALGQARAQEG